MGQAAVDRDSAMSYRSPPTLGRLATLDLVSCGCRAISRSPDCQIVTEFTIVHHFHFDVNSSDWCLFMTDLGMPQYSISPIFPAVGLLHLVRSSITHRCPSLLEKLSIIGTWISPKRFSSNRTFELGCFSDLRHEDIWVFPASNYRPSRITFHFEITTPEMVNSDICHMLLLPRVWSEDIRVFLMARHPLSAHRLLAWNHTFFQQVTHLSGSCYQIEPPGRNRKMTSFREPMKHRFFYTRSRCHLTMVQNGQMTTRHKLSSCQRSGEDKIVQSQHQGHHEFPLPRRSSITIMEMDNP